MRDGQVWQAAWASGHDPFSAAQYRPTEYEGPGSGRLPLRGGLLRARGGTTLHWAGLAFRFQVEDFELRSRTGIGADWPLTYHDLAAHYDVAERTLSVAGAAEDPGHPPRTGPFPLLPLPPQLCEERFIHGMNALGLGTQHVCIARNSVEARGRPRCRGVGTCLYCPLGARFTGDQLIDDLEGHPRFRLLTGTAAVRLRPRSRHRVGALDALVRATGDQVSIEADSFVVCAGAVETPKLLLASSSPEWPAGLGNATGHVGRHLTSHAFQVSTAREPEGKARERAKPLPYPTSVSRHFDGPTEQARGKFILWPGAEPLRIEEQMARGMELPEIARELDRPLVQTLTYQMEDRPRSDNRIELASGTDSFGLPRARIHYSLAGSEEGAAVARRACERILAAMGCAQVHWGRLRLSSHFLGTCRMSVAAEDGVVDEHLRVHGVENAFVCGGAVFPSGAAANPTLTIAALADRLGRHLATR